MDAPGSHEVISRALYALEQLEHRGGEGADPDTGDGSGILVQIPDAFLREEAGLDLPHAGGYGVAMCFLPQDEQLRRRAVELIERSVEAEGQRLIGWREVPIDESACGVAAAASAPHIAQLFVGAAGDGVADRDAFERKLYVIRRVVEREQLDDLSIASFSSRTVVYKGMLTAPQLSRYYPDLSDPRFSSRLALVHSRFSTNTFPSWELAHPYRMLAHNGEINTLRGNRNWMRAREGDLSSQLFGDDVKKIAPLLRDDISDSASLDGLLELLVLGGRSPAHAMSMLMPEAFQGRPELPQEVRDFYAYHSAVVEPWDGPAAVAFSDGRVIGATLDRNGLRPGRWLVTHDGWVVLASETGVFKIADDQVKAKGRLRPGKLFLVDLEADRIVPDEEIKQELAQRRPYGEWLRDRAVHIEDLPERSPRVPRVEPLRARQLAFGWSEEDLRVILAPMARDAAEPNGSMGNDLAPAAMSDARPPLFSYFKQLFAQVTNPAIDPIRESVVMSLEAVIGPEINLLGETPDHCHQLVMPQPILRNSELEKLRQVDHDVFEARTIDMTWPVGSGPEGMERRVEEMCREASELVERGVNIIILSDRNIGPDRAPMPSLLATAAVHHHLVREGTRLKIGLVAETGEAREIHHLACLIGYGNSAVNPYVMFESVYSLHRAGRLPDGMSPEEAEQRVVKAIGKGLLKVLSKMGISTIRSYTGAQIFEAVGLEPELVNRHFTGTSSRIGGVGLEVLAREALDRHARAYPAATSELLPSAGVYQWRRGGVFHGWNPETIASLQHAARNGDGAEAYERFARYVNHVAAPRSTLRGLLRFRDDIDPLPLDEVEPAIDIVRRFKSGGMSLGALSPEAHETLAVGMNRLGGKSNTGEGGEDPARFEDERRSSIKQVASGRFGVTVHYLANADELQIKVAQGAKPGEGGQLPGHKVDRYIAGLRFSTPGVTLISPPPHHDIYSIEDLKQLIYDLRCANPRARVSVKLVSEVGVGTIAAGVAKANADHVVIAGPRRRHRRLAPGLDPARRHPLGDRPGRDPADAAAQRPALAHPGGGRRPDAHRPRRGDRGDPRRRRVRLLHRPPDRARLRDDARVPPQHLPGGGGHPGSGAARALRGQARARGQLPVHGRGGGARPDGLARRALDRGADRPHPPAGGRRGGGPLEGARDRPAPAARGSRQRAREGAALAGPGARAGALGLDRRGPPPALPRSDRGGPPCPGRAADREQEPRGGRPALRRDRAAARRRRPGRRAASRSCCADPRARASAPGWRTA